MINLVLRESLRAHAAEYDRLNFGKTYKEQRRLTTNLELIDEMFEMMDNGLELQEAFNSCFGGDLAKYLMRAINKYGDVKPAKPVF